MERTGGFLRHLPEFGYEARVLTTSAFGGGEEEGVLRAWEPVGLYRRLFNRGAGETSSQTRSEGSPLRGVARLLGGRLLVPDGQVSWLPAALWKGLRSLGEKRPDLLYSTSPPASAHLLALQLKALVDLPWVADFRDGWTRDPLDPVLEEMPFRRALEERLEQRVVEAADLVVCATELAAEYMRQAHPRAAARVVAIPSGFDPEEFSGPDAGPPAGDPLRLVHTGSFSYSHPQRSPQTLFGALEALLAEDLAWAGRLRLVLVGALSERERAAARPLVEAGLVQVVGPQSRSEALAFQRGAHILLLVDHPRPWPAANVPGKFYEYLAMRRPVLALSGEGMVERLVRQTGAGVHAPVDDAAAIRRTLEQLYACHRRGALPGGAGEEVLRRFHRRVLTRDLASCFDRLLDSA